MPPEPADVAAPVNKLQKRLPNMFNEHPRLCSPRYRTSNRQRTRAKFGYARFADKLRQHARTEDGLFDSAALLAGEYIRLRQRTANE